MRFSVLLALLLIPAIANATPKVVRPAAAQPPVTKAAVQPPATQPAQPSKQETEAKHLAAEATKDLNKTATAINNLKKEYQNEQNEYNKLVALFDAVKGKIGAKDSKKIAEDIAAVKKNLDNVNTKTNAASAKSANATAAVALANADITAKNYAGAIKEAGDAVVILGHAATDIFAGNVSAAVVQYDIQQANAAIKKALKN